MDESGVVWRGGGEGRGEELPGLQVWGGEGDGERRVGGELGKDGGKL